MHSCWRLNPLRETSIPPWSAVTGHSRHVALLISHLSPLPLTVILTLIGMSASAPLGVLLALARRAKMPLLRTLAIGYIELVRGVPLLAVSARTGKGLDDMLRASFS